MPQIACTQHFETTEKAYSIISCSNHEPVCTENLHTLKLSHGVPRNFNPSGNGSLSSGNHQPPRTLDSIWLFLL